MIHQLIAQCINDAHIFNEQGKYPEAAARCRQVLRLSQDIPEAWFNLGVAETGQGNRQEALNAFEQARQRTQGSALAQSDIGLQLLGLEAIAEAEKCLERAHGLAPNEAIVLVNLGILREKQDRLDDAQCAFEQAIERRPEIAIIHANLGGVLNKKNNFQAAEACCRKALELDSTSAEAWNNLGNSLHGQEQFEAAETAFRKATDICPGMAEAWTNLGKSLIGEERFVDAGSACAKAIELAPRSAEAWMNMGIALRKLKQYAKAAQAFSNALSINPTMDFVLGEIIDAQRMDCAWDSIEDRLTELRRRIENDGYRTHHFSLFGFTSDPILLRKATAINAARFPENEALGPIPHRAPSNRIRIGYFSADFRPHPVAYLVTELFELHDRERFETIGFSFGPDSQDQYRKRIEMAFDRFVDVKANTSLEIAQMARNMGIDIAIDLMGFTEHFRSEIFALRAAPIQVSYLGYPGTTCLPYIDYLLADNTLIPDSFRSYYSEKIAYLPHSYQPNDRKRKISDRAFSRSEQGLPEAGFVFCCFNNTYKLSPETFRIWMRILGKIENSVLWLSRPTDAAVENLRAEAVRQGIAPERLVFAAQTPELADHLARVRLADLFLDTLPFNAHTTASDALWAGVPVLTCMGNALHSRVAGSLLNAVGLPELVTLDVKDYEQLAVSLAQNPQRLSALREKLQKNRNVEPLFDTPRLARNVESAYEQMLERHQAGMAPDHIFVTESPARV